MHDTATPRLAISLLLLSLIPDDANMREAYINKLDFIVKNSLYTYDNLLYELSGYDGVAVEFIDRLVNHITEGKFRSSPRYYGPISYSPKLNDNTREYIDADTDNLKLLLNNIYGLGSSGGAYGR